MEHRYRLDLARDFKAVVKVNLRGWEAERAWGHGSILLRKLILLREQRWVQKYMEHSMGTQAEIKRGLRRRVDQKPRMLPGHPDRGGKEKPMQMRDGNYKESCGDRGSQEEIPSFLLLVSHISRSLSLIVAL